MATKKWDNYFLFEQASELPGHPNGSADFTPMFNLNGNVMPFAPATTCAWYREPLPKWQLYRPHIDNCDEIIGYFGCNTEDPFDLGAEVEIYIGDEPYSFNKSCLLYLPQGTEHEPWRIKQVNRPIFIIHMYGLPNPVTWHGFSANDSKWSDYAEFPGREYFKTVRMEDITAIRPKEYLPSNWKPKVKGPEMKPSGKMPTGKGRYWKNFMFNQSPDNLGHPFGSFKFTQMFDISDRTMPGANWIFCSVFGESCPIWQRYRPHVHTDTEILAYIGLNPTKPFELGAEVEIYIEDEPYSFDRSCLLYMPPGAAHTPWRIKWVEHPYLGMYIHGAVKSGRAVAPTERDQRWSHLPWMAGLFEGIGEAPE